TLSSGSVEENASRTSSILKSDFTLCRLLSTLVISELPGDAAMQISRPRTIPDLDGIGRGGNAAAPGTGSSLGRDQPLAALDLEKVPESRRDRFLLTAGWHRHWLTWQSARAPLQCQGVLHTGREIVADDCVPEPQQALVDLERSRMVAALHRIPQR